MEQKKSLISKIGSLYNLSNKAWLIVALIGIGIAGLTYSPTQGEGDVKGVLGCNQTPASELKTLPDEQLKTIFSIAKIDIARDTVNFNSNKNYIPVVNEPKFTQYSETDGCMQNEELVVVVQNAEQTKVYPSKILLSNLIVNDKIADTDVVISYCGFCDSYQVYERKFQNESLSFGISNYIYKNSDLLFDNKSESLWSQMSGEALSGTFTGGKLKRYPFRLMSYQQAKTEFPSAEVLSFDTGSRRDYTSNQFKDFITSDEIPSPIFNASDKLKNKQLAIGFFLNNRAYAFTPDLMPEKINLDGRELNISKQGGEYIVIAGDEKMRVYQAYWYVWYDFNPETVIINKQG